MATDNASPQHLNFMTPSEYLHESLALFGSEAEEQHAHTSYQPPLTCATTTTDQHLNHAFATFKSTLRTYLRTKRLSGASARRLFSSPTPPSSRPRLHSSSAQIRDSQLPQIPPTPTNVPTPLNHGPVETEVPTEEELRILEETAQTHARAVRESNRARHDLIMQETRELLSLGLF
ncbi:hypothetical protein HDU79_011504 [Rhizoclosmatium sp. JEL0117]|nr:hypothetical protein HDU79_011504 [Rhizoclosmatium sp. JEL0117]